jgi:hypothetical protein
MGTGASLSFLDGNLAAQSGAQKTMQGKRRVVEFRYALGGVCEARFGISRNSSESTPTFSSRWPEKGGKVEKGGNAQCRRV